MDRSVDSLVADTIDSIRCAIDSNTVIGNPVKVDKITIIPITKVNVGFVVGGGNVIAKKIKKDFPFAGASTSGFNVVPLGFICIKNDKINYLSVDSGSVNGELANTLGKIMAQIINGEFNEK